jgi:C-terminal processing protease CtpA/Prc
MEKLKSGPRGSSPGKRPDSFIDKSGWVAPGVAYISFLAFMGDKPTLAQLRAFLASHSDAKVLIIDARRHHGGGMEEMDLIFSQLFGEPVDLLDLDTREAADARDGFDFGDLPTIRKVAAPAGVVRRVHSVIPAAAKAALRTAKVFVLTSSRTASAGEHFALALKSTGRATIVGETTRGAGNYGRHFDLPGGYSAFIPTGRTFDPKTGKGWEGVGVAPDVAVPADKALDEALKLAGVQVSGEAALAALH